MPTFGSLFAGIGGLDLGLDRAGWSPRWQVEIDPFCLRVLNAHWPDVPKYQDVREVGVELPQVDLICGGFPCQPVSYAGRGLAQDDPRWLWPEFARIVRVLRPRFVLVENVPGLLARGMGDVLGDLAACGYDAEWDCIPAAAVGAPHLRYRVWIVAHRAGDAPRPDSDRSGSHRASSDHAGPQREVQPGHEQGGDARSLGSSVAHSNGSPGRSARGTGQAVLRSSSFERFGRCGGSQRGPWAIEPDVGRVAHGVPSRVDRLCSLGNAVVPQLAEWIGTRIIEEFGLMDESVRSDGGRRG